MTHPVRTLSYMRHTERLIVRLSLEDKTLIEASASAARLSVAAWVRAALLAAAQGAPRPVAIDDAPPTPDASMADEALAGRVAALEARMSAIEAQPAPPQLPASGSQAPTPQALAKRAVLDELAAAEASERRPWVKPTWSKPTRHGAQPEPAQPGRQTHKGPASTHGPRCQCATCRSRAS